MDCQANGTCTSYGVSALADDVALWACTKIRVVVLTACKSTCCTGNAHVAALCCSSRAAQLFLSFSLFLRSTKPPVSVKCWSPESSNQTFQFLLSLFFFAPAAKPTTVLYVHRRGRAL